FLKRLSPLHKRWHSTNLPTRIGFLDFHWHVVRAFKVAGGETYWSTKIVPYTEADFKNTFQYPYDVTAKATEGDFDSLARFSADIQDWHNDAHMNIGMVDGFDMMDPKTNIFHPEFWRLHFFINDKFRSELAVYDPKGTDEARVARLEETHGKQ